ncbi:MAG: adenine deaminase, partial [Deltaproteobacteria bacterium]
ADMVLKGGRVVNIFTHEVIEADVAICGGVIAAVGENYDGNSVVQVDGMFVCPGLIDAHIHMESSMLHPRVLADSLLVCGTTTIIADPHEIANVAGLEGIDFMMSETANIPFDALFVAPSCVPASHLETSGARLGHDELKRLACNPRILGLAEVMNYPAVVEGAEDIMGKIQIFSDRVIDGHAPGLSGEALQAYVSVGIRSDHECTTRQEALEKLRAGMTIMIREGTLAKSLAQLAPLVSHETASRFCFVSDDLHPQDIRSNGHMNGILRKAVSSGMEPLLAIRLATINPASFFRLYDRGAISPGYRADIVIFSDLVNLDVWGVVKNGKMVVANGQPLEPIAEKEMPSPGSLKIMRVPTINSDDLKIPCEGKKRARIIELIEGQILTRAAVEEIQGRRGEFPSDTRRDILKIAVTERYTGSGRVGLGLVRGFKLEGGAIASSVAHDSHNIVAVGVDAVDIATAINGIKDMGGGIIVAAGGQVIEKLPLPIAGLMSDLKLDEVVAKLSRLGEASRSLGCPLKDPFMALSFLALPVIPEIRLTDLGIIDVSRFEVVPLFL